MPPGRLKAFCRLAQGCRSRGYPGTHTRGPPRHGRRGPSAMDGLNQCPTNSAPKAVYLSTWNLRTGEPFPPLCSEPALRREPDRRSGADLTSEANLTRRSRT